VVLAALMLKFGLPFLGVLYDEILLSLFFALFCLFCLSSTKDVKVFIAYSSILHMTVFCVRLANFSTFLVEYFLVPHTLLSGLLFWYLSTIYGFLGVRSLSFFGAFYAGALILFWLGVPFLVSFLVELIIFFFVFFEAASFLLWLLVF